MVEPLAAFYEVFVQAHPVFLKAASEPLPDIFEEGGLGTAAERFLHALLTPDEGPAVEVVKEQITAAAGHLPIWWEKVIAPALRTVGSLWSQGRISVAQEHVATAIAERILSHSFPRLPRPLSSGRVIAVVLPAGERHTLGAEMVRDFLTLCGHQVIYTGADTPTAGVAALLENNDVEVLLIPTTMPTALVQVLEMVQEVREQLGERAPQIAVGGQAYQLDEALASKVGADVYIPSLEQLDHYLQKLNLPLHSEECT